MGIIRVRIAGSLKADNFNVDWLAGVNGRGVILDQTGGA
jgi:hypothetical protein